MSGRPASEARIPQADVHGAPKLALTVDATQRLAGHGVDINLHLNAPQGQATPTGVKVSAVEIKVNGKAYSVPPESISSQFGRFSTTLRYDGEGRKPVNSTLTALVRNKPAELNVTYVLDGKKHQVSSKFSLTPMQTGPTSSDDD